MLDNTSAPASHLPVTRRFADTETTYEWREVVVDFKTGEKLNCRVPVAWSDNAAAVLMSKYAVKAGVPERCGGVNGREVDAFRVFSRLVMGWRKAAIGHGYWEADDPNLDAFCAELVAMLEQQVAAPNSPQWFNTGVHEAYGITASADGHYYATVDEHGTATAHACSDSLARPQVSACFIQHVGDALVGEGGIMDLWHREARLFKYGSGSGANYSALRGRGEPLSRGGTSSGLLSFLRVGDRSAGAIKSGGTTRRSARMVVVDVDHPDVEDFIAWKPSEDAKIRALHAAGIGDPASFEDEATETVSGQNANNSVSVTDAFMHAVCNDDNWTLTRRTDGSAAKVVEARELWGKIAKAAWECADPGLQFRDTINGWHTCSNDGEITASNPCCLVQETLVHTEHGFVQIGELARMFDEGTPLPRVWAWDNGAPTLRQCLRAWKAGDARELRIVETTTGTKITCTPEHRFLLASGEYVEAQHLVQTEDAPFTTPEGREIVGFKRVPTTLAAGLVKDVFGLVYYMGGVQVFDIEVEGVHNFMVTDHPDNPPVVVHNSEYVFLDDTACNLASLNLIKFYGPKKCTHCDGRQGWFEAGASDNDRWVPCLLCNVASQGFDFDLYQHAVRLWTIVLDISVSMAGYPTAEIARRSMLYRTLGLGYASLGELLVKMGVGYGTEQGLEVASELTSYLTATAYLTSTELAAKLGAFPRYEANRAHVRYVLMRHHVAADRRASNTTGLWAEAINQAERYGVRNAQVTLLAPCGTIGIVMDCETTGCEPYYSDTTMKKLAGGGTMRLASRLFGEVLREHGYDPDDYTRHVWTVEGGAVREYVWVQPPEELRDVLVCADDLTPTQHVNMMAAVQPFLSGAISKTVNMASDATVEDVADMYLYAWRSGLKSIAIYRDGCKPAQPLQGRKPPKTVVAYARRELAEADLADVKPQGDDEYNATFIPYELTLAMMRSATANHGTPSKRPLARGERVTPPDETFARRVKLSLNGHTLYLVMSEHVDGTLAEVFVTSPRTGSSISGWVNAWAKQFSLALQHGTPLAVLVDAARGEQFEPAGYLNGRPVTSPIDAIARVIAERYLSDEHAVTLSDAGSLADATAVPSEPLARATGQICHACGSMNLRRSGTCYVCETCGTTTGCS